MIFCWTKTTILMLIYFPSLSDETVDFKQRIILQIIVAINVSQSTLKVVYGHENNESPVFRNSRRKTVREDLRRVSDSFYPMRKHPKLNELWRNLVVIGRRVT